MHLSAVAVDLDVGHLFETVTFHQLPGILLLQLEGLLTSLESYSLATGLLMHHLAWEHSVMTCVEGSGQLVPIKIPKMIRSR